MNFHFDILKFNPFNQTSYKKFIVLYTVFSFFQVFAQNSLIGDGFGGRLWYQPANYTVGSYSAYTVCGDSDQLYGWGANHHGQLGDNTFNSTISPVKVLGMTNTKYYSTGYNMAAIKHDSTGWVWGNSLSKKPVKVIDSVKFVDAGSTMCIFVKYDGTVWSVGMNNKTFGDNNVAYNYTLVPKKMNLIKNAVRVANSRLTNTILLEDGTLMSCGVNTNYTLGVNSLPSFEALTPIPLTTLSKIVDIKATAATVVALDSFGDVYTWGSQFTPFFIREIDTPTQIKSLKNIVAISGSNDGYTFLALDADHNCYAWGLNANGTFGDGTISATDIPRLVATDVVDIMVGETFTYIIKVDGSLWATGESNSGSIWMNIKDTVRHDWTQIDPTIAPLNLCGLSSFEGNYFRVLNTTCIYDTILFEPYNKDSFINFKWDFGDNYSTDSGKLVKHKFNYPGIYTVKLISEHIRLGYSDTIVRKIQLHQPNPIPILGNDTLICGPVLFTKRPQNEQEYYFYQWEDNSIRFERLIWNPGVYSLKISDINGCYYYDTFTVAQHEKPKVKFKADTYSQCLNDSKSIKFTNLSTCSDSIVKVVWNFTEDTLNSMDSVVYYKYKKADLYPVFLHVYSEYGCVGDTIDVIDILPSPSPQFDLTINDSCLSSNQISLKNNTLTEPDQKPKYKWYFSEKHVISNSDPAPRSYIDTGNYYIDLIYNYQNGCLDTLRKHVTIYPNPELEIKYNGPICSLDSIVLNQNSSKDYSPLKFTWNIQDSAYIGHLDSLKYQFGKKGKYNIKLSAVNSVGCKNTTVKTIDILAPPKVNFTINDTIQCLIDNAFNFNAQATADTGIISSYAWNLGDNTYSYIETPLSKTYANTGTYLIKLTVKDEFGCSSSASHQVHIKNGPVSNFSINKSSQCENEQNFTFKFAPNQQNDSIVSLEWIILNKSYFNNLEQQISNFPIGKSSVKLVLKTQFGCPGITTKDIMVNPLPKIQTSVNAPIQCFDNHNFIFTNNSSIPIGSIKSAQWSFSDLSADNSSIVNKQFIQLGHHWASLHLISDSNCTNLDTIKVQLNPNPELDIAKLPAICVGQKVSINNLSTISNDSITLWNWDFGNQSQSNEYEPVFIYNYANNFDITLNAKSDKNCESTEIFKNWIIVNPSPTAAFTYTIKESNNNSSLYSFENKSSPTPQFSQWDFGKHGMTNKDSSIEIIDTTTLHITLFVRDSNSCTDQIEKTIFASGPLQVYIPNAFTPNQDLLNEYFLPKGSLNTEFFEFKIYNRWGEELFQTNKSDLGWDGTYQNAPCQDGIYMYVLNIKDRNGKTKSYRGTFTLMR